MMEMVYLIAEKNHQYVSFFPGVNFKHVNNTLLIADSRRQKNSKYIDIRNNK